MAKLEQNDYIPPSNWTRIILEKIAGVDAFSRFAPGKANRLAHLGPFTSIPAADDAIISQRKIKTLKRIKYLVSQAEIPHAEFKRHLLSGIESSIVESKFNLRNAKERLKRNN